MHQTWQLLPLRDRAGTISVMVAVALPALLLMAGVSLEVGSWARPKQQLQHSADAAATGGAQTYGTTGNAQIAAGVVADLAELNGAAGGTRTWNAATGTLSNGGVSVTVAASVITVGRTSVTVDLSRSVGAAASALIPGGAGVRTITASGTAEAWTTTTTTTSTSTGPCILALDPSTNQSIKVDNMGQIIGSGCKIHSNSSASQAIYLNSGTISGSAVSAVGTVAKSNSGSNTFAPWPATSGAAAIANPHAGKTMPAYGACSYTNASFTAWQATPYIFSQARNVFCGNTTIGGNNTTQTFEPGLYFVVNGSLTFNNANVTQANGVTFILTGSSPGGLSWTNYSNGFTTITAPSTGATAGLVFWQGCTTSNIAPDSTLAGGSTLQIAGGIYAPCGLLKLSNNAKMTSTATGALNVGANRVYAAGSATLTAKPMTTTTSTVTASRKLVK